MKKTMLFALTWIVLLTTNNVSAWQEYINKSIDWHNVKVIKVILDWNHKVITASSNSWEDFETLVKNAWWVSWVNWGYFCPADYSHCWWKNSTNNMRIQEWEISSQYWKDLWEKWLMWFDEDGKPYFIANNYWYVAWLNKKYNHDKFDELEYGISNFPVYLLEWENVVNSFSEIDDKKMNTKWIKTFICHDQSRTNIYMWNVSNITVPEMSNFIKTHFECYNAINLDSGWSLWMMYEWDTIYKPWRQIMDAFVVIETNDPSTDFNNENNNISNDVYRSDETSNIQNNLFLDFENDFEYINDMPQLREKYWNMDEWIEVLYGYVLKNSLENKIFTELDKLSKKISNSKKLEKIKYIKYRLMELMK